MATKEEPDWLRLQKKIFTRYINQKFRQAGSKSQIANLINDVKDGVLIVELLEILSGKPYAGKKLAPTKARIQQLDNNSKAVEFLKSCGVKSQASSEDITDGNEKLVLGTIFQVIIKYMKFDEEEESSNGDVKEALMLWLKNKTAGYRDVAIENFTKSFHDGLAFCALIHKLRPKLIPYDSLKKEDKLNNLTLALDVAAKYCNVEKYLEASDIAKLDELSMIVYLSDWYYGVALLQKQDISARRIGKLVVMTELHDKMRADYLAGAEKLKQWVDQKINDLKDRSFDNTLAGIRKRLDNFYDYKAQDKSNRLTEHLDLSALFNNLALRLQNNKRPPFQPPQNFTLQALDSKFQELETAEAECSSALHTELARQIKLHNMAKRLKADADKLRAAFTEKENYAKRSESIDSVESAETALDHSAVELAETNLLKSSRLADIKKVAAELYKEKFENSDEIRKVEGDLESFGGSVLSQIENKKKTLEGELAKQLAINDNLCKEFADAVKVFSDWLTQKKYHLSSNTSDLEKQLADLVQSTNDHNEAAQKLSAINAVDAKIKARLITNNKYTNITAQDCSAQWSQYEILIKKKKELLESQIEEKKKAGLTEEQVTEIQKTFEYYDKDNNGWIDKKELRGCLQALGEEATPKDVEKVLKEYDHNNDNKLSMAEFTQYMYKQLGDSNSKEEIVTAFNYLTFDKPTIKSESLEAVVNNISFKDKHVEYLKKEMKTKDDGFDWPTWVDAVFSR